MGGGGVVVDGSESSECVLGGGNKTHSHTDKITPRGPRGLPSDRGVSFCVSQKEKASPGAPACLGGLASPSAATFHSLKTGVLLLIKRR